MLAADEVAAVFLDANSALHFQRFSYVDWKELVSAEQVQIVLAPVFVRELDKHKYSERRRLRDRASATLSEIWRLLADNDVATFGEGLTVRYEHREPTIDFAKFNLAPDCQDDHLLASVIAFRVEHPNARTVIASGDKGLLLKARAQNIDVLEIPQKYLLPDDADPLEAENNKLRRQLSELQNREPKLSIHFADGQTRQIFRIQANSCRPNIDDLVEQARRRLPKLVSQSQNATHEVGLRVLAAVLSREQMMEYDEQLEEYFNKLREYYERRQKISEIRHRTIESQLVVSNGGTAQALDVEVKIIVPEEILVLCPANTF
jgi:predicted ribonuclease YlaK